MAARKTKDSARSRRWPSRLGRALVFALVGVLGLALLAVVGASIALRRPAMQQQVIEGISAAIEPGSGVTIEAEGFDLNLVRGSVEVRGLKLRAGAGEPFATVDRTRIGLRPMSLIRGPIRLSLLELEHPEVNADAPFPEPSSDAPEEPLESLALIVDNLRVVTGRARGTAAEATRAFLESWEVGEIHAEGRFDGRTLAVSKLSAGARIGRGQREAVELDVDAAGSVTLSGGTEVKRFVISSDALALDASLALADIWEESSGAFRIAVDPGVWFGDGSTELVRLEGDVDLAAWQGSVRFAAADQPAALIAAAGLLAPELADSLELASTSLDLRFALDLDRGGAGERSVAGEAVASARRDGAVVVELEARSSARLPEGALAAAAAHSALQVGADLRLLPGEGGRREVTARLLSDDVSRGEGWRLEGGRMEVEQPSLAGLLGTIARLWPRLLAPESIRGLPDLGELRASADFAGTLDDPRLEARARLTPDASGHLDLVAKGRPLANDWNIEAEGVNLEIEQFTTAASGTVDFTARVRDPLGSAAGTLALSGRGIGTGTGPLLAALELGIDGTLESLAWTVEAALAEGGSVQGDGTVRPERPLRKAGGSVAWSTGDERVPRLDATFALAGGRLAASARGAVVAPASPLAAPALLEVDLELPLAALDALPQLGDLSTLPIERASGPVLLSWRAPTNQWRDFLPASWVDRAGAAGIAGLEAGSVGEMALDLGCPACSSGAVELSDVAVEMSGRSARASTALSLRLAEGQVVVEPWVLAGDGLELEISGQAGLATRWRLGEPVPELVQDVLAAVAARVDSAWLDSLPVEIVTPGTLVARAEASGPLAALGGSLSLAAADLSLALDAFPSMVVTGAEVDGSLREGYVEWQNLRFAVNDASVSSEGRALLENPLADSVGTLWLDSGLPVLTAAVLPFQIADGWLTVEAGRITTAGGEGTVRLDVPADGGAGATARVEWSLPVNDWAPLLERVQGSSDPDVLELASRGRMTLPLDWPTAAEAVIELTSGRIVVRGRETRIEPRAEITLRDGALEIVPFRLRTAGQLFLFEAKAVLADGWVFGDDPAQLIADFDAAGSGDIDSGLLNPFLLGGRAEGSLNLDFEVSGTPSSYGGRVRASGPAATVVFRSPYLTRLESPDLEIVIRDGRVGLERASFRLNEGSLEASGVLSEGGRTDLALRITDSVFRLDYGLVATLRGELGYRLGVEGDSAISGVVNVERGALTRAVRLDLDLLSQLLAPIDLTTTQDDPLDLVYLNLEVRTREGVRVKNNLGDLLVRWEPLQVTGTLARPIIEGRLEVDPGGLLYAYGQTVRLDKAVIEYPGEYGVEPRLDFSATTSLEDPTIGQLAGTDPFKSTSRTEEAAATPATQEVTADLARFYGEQVAGKVGESVGVSVSLRPLLIFGETDPGARLTVSRDLSTNLALAASIDLTGAEDRTYLLELHELRTLPRLVAQGFTDDGSAYGGALLQRQQWGGSRPERAGELPKISKVVSTPPKGISRRGIRRAIGLEKGDFFDSQQRFVAEVELVDYLLRKGYPDARVAIRAVSDDERERRVRLEVDILPGPHVEFVFEGEKIPDPLKLLIRSLYRPDFFEAESIEEMRTETVRALRSRGFLEPKVEISVGVIAGADGVADRRVTVRTTGGERISQEPPVFLGLPSQDVEVLNVAFANAVQRVELAVGLPSADRRLLTTLAGLGYPQANIVSRFQSIDERVLTVEIDPGPRERIAEVFIEGVSPLETPGVQESDLTSLVAVAAGDPLRRTRLSRTAIAIERHFGKQGYLDARVRTSLEADPAGDPYVKTVRFVVEPGPRSILEGVDFKGLRSTREGYARRVAGLETGKPLAREDLSQARTSLWKTGLFKGVAADFTAAESGLDRVVFDLEERDRYRLTYGVRWDSADGIGAVVDATDDNFLGRGWTLGLRLLTSSDEDSVRGLVRIPRAFGGPGALEAYAAARQFTEIGTLGTGSVDETIPVEAFESTLQYSQPLSEKTTFRIYGRYTDITRSLPILPGVVIPVQVKNPQLGFQYVYDSRSQEAIVERGIFASLDVSGSKEFLGGDLSYVRSFSQVSLFRRAGRLFGSRLLWSQSYRLGLAEAFGQELTRDVRFFAGGEYSVRGYETEFLGELDRVSASVTRALGGPALLVINQELRWRLFEDYTLVGFVDAGNVWQTIGDFGRDLFASTGLGVRALTPVGLLRLDIARPLDGRLGIDPDYKIYFGLGTSF